MCEDMQGNILINTEIRNSLNQIEICKKAHIVIFLI